MNRADFLNKERWDAQRNTTIGSKLDRIIDLLEKLTSEEEKERHHCVVPLDQKEGEKENDELPTN